MHNSEDLRAWMVAHGVAFSYSTVTGETATVPTAARALGVTNDDIIKSLVFLINGEPHVIIANGEHLVSDRKVAALFGLGRKRVKLAPIPLALEITGYMPGVMPPFGHDRTLPTILSARVLERPHVYGATGENDVMLRMTPGELARVTGARVVEVTDEG